MINTKKVNAVILALIIAFSMCVPAFAEESATSSDPFVECEWCHLGIRKSQYKDHVEKEHMTQNNDGWTPNYYTCPGCGKQYTSMERYNECIDSHNYGVDYHWDDYINMTLPELFDWALNWFNNLISVFTGADNDDALGIFGNITQVLLAITNKIVGAIGGLQSGDQAAVAGAVDDLDATVKGLDLSKYGLNGIHDIISTIKTKVKDFYAGDKADVEITVAEAPAETGSANVGLAAFAAISVAAAAAFVCTKKKA